MWPPRNSGFVLPPLATWNTGNRATHITSLIAMEKLSALAITTTPESVTV